MRFSTTVRTCLYPLLLDVSCLGCARSASHGPGLRARTADGDAAAMLAGAPRRCGPRDWRAEPSGRSYFKARSRRQAAEARRKKRKEVTARRAARRRQAAADCALQALPRMPVVQAEEGRPSALLAVQGHPADAPPGRVPRPQGEAVASAGLGRTGVVAVIVGPQPEYCKRCHRPRHLVWGAHRIVCAVPDEDMIDRGAAVLGTGTDRDLIQRALTAALAAEEEQ